MDSAAKQRIEPGPRPVVLEASGLRKCFEGTEVLRNVNLTLHRGEVVLLRGPNGAGKTTLISVLAGYVEADGGEITIRTNGAVERFSFPVGILERLNPFSHFLPERVACEGVIRTWQDTRLFPSLSLAENIAVAAPRHPGQNPLNLFLRSGTVKRFEKNVIEGASQQLGLLRLAGRDSSSGDRISLGQTKRVAIAQAVNAQARVLFFDEPLAGLDADGILMVVDMLRELARDHGISIVIVEHQMNASHILKIAETVWTLDRGLLESRPVAEVTSEYGAEKTDALAALLERTGWRIDHEQGLSRGACFRTHRYQGHTYTKSTRLEVQGLAIKRGRRWVIGRVDEDSKIVDLFNLRLDAGELGLLLAPNGWGKTTALDAIAGIIPVEAGLVRLQGICSTELPAWRRFNLGLRYLRARAHAFPNLSVSDQLALADHKDNHIAPPLLPRKVGSLSGGERQMLLSHLIGNSSPEILLLDEPFSGLDPSAFAEAAENAFSLCKSGTALLIALPT